MLVNSRDTGSSTTIIPPVMQCIYINRRAVFDWDESNRRKIRAHRIKAEEVEEALSNAPILIYEQDVEGEARYVYYGETDSGGCWP